MKPKAVLPHLPDITNIYAVSCACTRDIIDNKLIFFVQICHRCQMRPMRGRWSLSLWVRVRSYVNLNKFTYHFSAVIFTKREK